MSEKEADRGKEAPGEKGYRTPGLRGAQTTTLFRAVNPELFIKPVRPGHTLSAAPGPAATFRLVSVES